VPIAADRSDATPAGPLPSPAADATRVQPLHRPPIPGHRTDPNAGGGGIDAPGALLVSGSIPRGGFRGEAGHPSLPLEGHEA